MNMFTDFFSKRKNLNKLPNYTKSSQLITQLRLNADPQTICADGISKSTLSLQLLDKKDNPAIAEADFIIKISADKGKLAQSTVIIPKGMYMAKTFITSSNEKGLVLVSAHLDGLQEVTIALNFKEEVLHCLYCGAVVPSFYEPCPICGRIPP